MFYDVIFTSTAWNHPGIADQDVGKVQMPVDKAGSSPRIGAVADKFDVGWMVYVEPKEEY